jgi:hypothetical protein
MAHLTMAAHAATPCQRRVGGVDDGVDSVTSDRRSVGREASVERLRRTAEVEMGRGGIMP